MKRITIATLRAAAKPLDIIIEKVEDCCLEIHAPDGKAFGGEDGFRSRVFEWMPGCPDWRLASMTEALEFLTGEAKDLHEWKEATIDPQPTAATRQEEHDHATLQ